MSGHLRLLLIFPPKQRHGDLDAVARRHLQALRVVETSVVVRHRGYFQYFISLAVNVVLHRATRCGCRGIRDAQLLSWIKFRVRAEARRERVGLEFHAVRLCCDGRAALLRSGKRRDPDLREAVLAARDDDEVFISSRVVQRAAFIMR